MVPQTQRRQERNSSKVNLLISFTVHAVIVLVAFYLAARGGLLGKQMKKIAVEMVKEKPPEKPKEPEKQPEPPKQEPPKEQPKVETVKAVETPKVSAPPPLVAPPAVAPPAADLPAFEFEGGKTVETSSNPVELYRGLLQAQFTSKWDKPEDLADANYVAEIRVAISSDGKISEPQWLKASGNKRWDDSVRNAISAMTRMERPPPTNFPPRVVVRFDVQELTEPVLD